MTTSYTHKRRENYQLWITNYETKVNKNCKNKWAGGVSNPGSPRDSRKCWPLHHGSYNLKVQFSSTIQLDNKLDHKIDIFTYWLYNTWFSEHFMRSNSAHMITYWDSYGTQPAIDGSKRKILFIIFKSGGLPPPPPPCTQCFSIFGFKTFLCLEPEGQQII